MSLKTGVHTRVKGRLERAFVEQLRPRGQDGRKYVKPGVTAKGGGKPSRKKSSDGCLEWCTAVDKPQAIDKERSVEVTGRPHILEKKMLGIIDGVERDNP